MLEIALFIQLEYRYIFLNYFLNQNKNDDLTYKNINKYEVPRCHIYNRKIFYRNEIKHLETPKYLT